MPAIFPLATKASGDCIAMPDVCKVPAPPAPPVPVPFPNMAQMTSAVETSTKVFVENKPIVVQASKLPSSSGDEAGTAGGVVSGVTKGEVTFKTASGKVFVEGKKAVLLTATTAHNGSNANAVGVHASPSQGKVIGSP